MKYITIFAAALYVLSGCSINRQITRQAAPLLHDSAVNSGHTGICIYEPATGKYWYNYNSSHYFIPASNTKLFTLYAGMKYLGDSLAGLRYETPADNYTIFSATGDPTFLHPDFKNQPAFAFLQKAVNPSLVTGYNTGFSPFGKGWAWDDYQSDYAAERSEMPVYGNLATFYLQNDTIAVSPRFFYNRSLQWLNGVLRNGTKPQYIITRGIADNIFHGLNRYGAGFVFQQVPYKTVLADSMQTAGPVFLKLLEDTLHKKIPVAGTLDGKVVPKYIIRSQPSDSLFKPMMHRSDNFFAEQTLLMASNEYLGYMSDEKMIDTILKTSLKDVPQKPKWVDGSGLSRYNLFTPQSFVYILNKMKDEFGLDRMKIILPTGGEGTISSYYKKETGYIYVKTGTLSNNCALSGYLFTKKGKLLIFSVLNNNYIGAATPVRRAVERFLESIREKF